MYDHQSKRTGIAIFQGKMPRKNCANHAQAENWALAGNQKSSCSVGGFQVQDWQDRLLLLQNFIHSARFHQPVLTAGRACDFM